MSYNEFLSYEGLKKLWEIIKSTFVAKEEGKGLSSKDFTLEYIDKIEHPEKVGDFPESVNIIDINNNENTYIRGKDIIPILQNKSDKTIAFGLETNGLCAHSIFNGYFKNNNGAVVTAGLYVPLFLIESNNLGKALLFFTLYSRDSVNTTYTASYYFSSRSGLKYDLLLNDFTASNTNFITKDSVGFIKINNNVYLIVRKVLKGDGTTNNSGLEDPFVVSVEAKEVWDLYANITCFTSFETEKEHPNSPGTKIVFHESISEYTYDGVTYNINENYIPCSYTGYLIANEYNAGLVKSGGDITIQSDGTMQVVDDSHNHIISNVDGLQSTLDGKVDKVSGKGLSTNDYTTVEKNKLAGIASGAEVNVQSDWNTTDSTLDSFIKNKPTIPVVGNGTITINQSGVKKGSFDLNQEGDLTIELADSNTTYTDATTSESGLMSTSDKSKLDGISAGAEINQNAFSNVKVGTTTITSDSKTDTLTLEAGSNVTLTPDATNDKITITAKDTTYGNVSTDNNGLMLASDKIKLDSIASNSEKNTIIGIKRNGTLLTPDNDRVINIPIPTKTSELTNDSAYLTSSDVASTITGLLLNTSTGVITVTRKNGTTFTIDLPTEKVIKSGYYDSEEEEIVLVLADDSEIRFSASELIDSYYGDDSTIELYTDTNDSNKKKFRITTSYKNKIDNSEQTSNRVTTVDSSSLDTKYPTALAVWNAIKNFATNTQTFTQATTRANIETGETISTIFGKIKKWFADLKTVAFTGSYNDLSNKPTIGSGEIIIKQAGTLKGSFKLNDTTGVTIELSDNNTTYSTATTTADGLMSSSDKSKLQGIASGAEVNVQSDWSVTDTSSDAYVKNKPTIPTVNNATVTIKQAGVSKGSFTLNQSTGTTIELTDDNTTYSPATTSANGLMSASDKSKLDGIANNANKYSLPVATSSALGGVKSGGDITVASDGTVSVNDNSHNHSASNITSGTLAVARGGTGQTSTVNAANAFINALTEGTSTPVDNDYMITQSVNGGTTTTTYHRRKMSVVWEYFKSKISSVLGLTSSNYGGTAAKATKDGSGNTITSTYATKSQLTDGSVTKVGTATKGSTTKPIYLNAGVPTECDDYAGGTAVTLNGSSKSGSTTSFYAPTNGNINGTNNWVLISSGPNFAPQFKDILQFGISNGVTFNKFHRGISFFNKKMYQSGSAECDWTYSSAVVFSGATITFTNGLSTAIESGVMTLWLEKGAIVKVDEWVSNWETYETRTYIAQRSGLLFVGCWGDPKVYTLSSLDLFDKGIIIISTTDSRMIKQSDNSYIIDLISDNILYDTIVIQNDSNTATNYSIRLIKMNDIPNGHKIRVLCVNAWAHFIRSSTAYGFSNLSYTSSRPLNANCFAEFLYFNSMWYSDQY